MRSLVALRIAVEWVLTRLFPNPRASAIHAPVERVADSAIPSRWPGFVGAPDGAPAPSG